MNQTSIAKLNYRMFLLLYILAMAFAIRFALLVMKVISLSNVISDSSINPPSIIATVVLFFIIILISAIWYFRTRRHYGLKVKRSKVVFILVLIWFAFYIICVRLVPFYFEYFVSALIMFVGVYFFLSKNRIKTYHSKVLLSITLGLSYIFLIAFLAFIIYIAKQKLGFDIVDYISHFFAFVPSIWFKISLLLVGLFIYSSLISLRSFGSLDAEEISNEYLENNYLDS